MREALIDPRAFIDVAPPSSPLWPLIDAFDAATNGMENPEAYSRLAAVEEEAFAPWKALVAAILAFYAEDPRTLDSHLARIPENSPPAVLTPLFRAWLGAPSGARAEALTDAAPGVSALYRRLTTDPHPLQAVAEQAEEALRQDMIEHFEKLSCRVLKELHEASFAGASVQALRYAARCLDSLCAAGRDDTDFYAALLRSLGRADGLTAIALALIDRDDQAAASAFAGTLESRDGGFFVDDDMKPVIEAAIGMLRNEAESRHKPQPRRRAPASSRPASAAGGQLDLFEEIV